MYISAFARKTPLYRLSMIWLLFVSTFLIGYRGAKRMSSRFDYEVFVRCAREMVRISDELDDGWIYNCRENCENGAYVTKKSGGMLETNTLVMYEYHVAYNVNYGVPILCFNAWKQDGSVLRLEEYCANNSKFDNVEILKTLTQMDHPVLCKPFLTLHPCKTHELLATFRSKNPVISWLSVVGPFLNLTMDEVYAKLC